MAEPMRDGELAEFAKRLCGRVTIKRVIEWEPVVDPRTLESVAHCMDTVSWEVLGRD